VRHPTVRLPRPLIRPPQHGSRVLSRNWKGEASLSRVMLQAWIGSILPITPERQLPHSSQRNEISRDTQNRITASATIQRAEPPIRSDHTCSIPSNGLSGRPYHNTTPPKPRPFVRFVRKNRGWIRALVVCQVCDRGRVQGRGRYGIRMISHGDFGFVVKALNDAAGK